MNPWFLRGKVIHGFGRGGTQLGYPTANVELSMAAIEFLKPYDNLVLWGWGCVEPESAPSSENSNTNEGDAPRLVTAAQRGPFPFVMSIGNNPQFENVDISAEVYFLHKFECDFYGYTLRIATLETIRRQSAFTTLEELIKTIDGDVVFAKEHLKLPQWASYGHHKMVQPDVAAAELNLPEELPAFGSLERAS